MATPRPTVETTSDTTPRHDDVIVTVTPAPSSASPRSGPARTTPTRSCLRVEVTGINGVDYTYDLSFEPIADAVDGDVTVPRSAT